MTTQTLSLIKTWQINHLITNSFERSPPTGDQSLILAIVSFFIFLNISDCHPTVVMSRIPFDITSLPTLKIGILY